MKELSSFLRKFHKQTKIEDASSQVWLKAMKSTLTSFNIPFTCKNDADFYRYEVFNQGLKNKQLLEVSYDRIRNELIDLWDHVDYQERKSLMALHQQPIKETLCSFTTDTKAMIPIPFFDELINTLYVKEMVVFELPQFFKLYTDFKGSMIDPWVYKHLPYQSGFCSLDFIATDALSGSFVLFDKTLQILYHIDSKGEWTSFPFDLSASKVDRQDAQMFAQYLLKGQMKYFAGHILSIQAGSVACRKELLKRIDLMSNALGKSA